MKYALIKNAQLGHLLDRDANSQVMWDRYGFNSDHLSRLSTQGEDSNGDQISLLPISDESAFNAMLPSLQAKIDSDLFPNDSIEVLSDEAAITAVKDDVAAVREAKKAESQMMSAASAGDMQLILKELAAIKSLLENK